MIAGLPRAGQARLDPYYIIHSQGGGVVAPRVLFVLDNSGSMAMDETYVPDAQYPNTKCRWDNCENADAGVLQSRIHAARGVIQTLVAANDGKADFALMTFGGALPPADPAEVPEPCVDPDTNQSFRFTWIDAVNQPYSTIWKPAHNPFGAQGIWLLCGDNRPFPYLRHDELGAFSLPNHSQDPLADAPLYLQQSTLSGYEDASNYTRRVQWFPRFLGRRGHLDCSDPGQQQVVLASYGDWGNDDADKLDAVCDRDFYYWPYVDGNPGYSFYDGQSYNTNFEHQECDDNAVCKTSTDPVHRLGVVRRDQWVGASLYAPFYSQAAIDDPNLAAAAKGPSSPAEARIMLDGIIDKQYAGGADVTGGTPMAVAIGVVENLVKTDNQGALQGPKPSLPQSNAPFAHDTVASYLAFMRLVDDEQLCRPVTMIIITDGQPDPWWKQGGAKLYERLRSVRQILGVRTYVVAFTKEVYDDPLSFERIHEIACAAAGADSIPTPCAGGNLYDWDTCFDGDDPANGCAWLAEDHAELSAALTSILDRDFAAEVPGGAPTVANDFQLADPNDPNSNQAAVQTSLRSWTETPSWRGHVVREACDDPDPDNPGELAPYCKNAGELELEGDELESFGPCPRGRIWDAGVCLQQTAAADRRLFTHDAEGQLLRIAEAGEPTPAFVAQVQALDDQGLIQPPLTPGNQDAEIAAMVDLLLGTDAPEGWKLPGLSNAAPILIRRVPAYDGAFSPSVGIRDPHCAGRRKVAGDDVPPSLQAFAGAAWQTSAGGGLASHYDYTEAVLIGDDFGLLHGFHYDSGNELFAFLPRALINNARVLAVNQGLAASKGYGQPDDLAKHVYGVAATVNAGWIYDDQAERWRHLAVFGLGPGGAEIIALDVSHMGQLQDDAPIDLLWTSSTTAIAPIYAETLGQTWSRPALTYATINDQIGLEPKAYLVFASGYRDGDGPLRRGRVLWRIDALTGESVGERAYLPPPSEDTSFDHPDDVVAIGDIAVGSHCLSRYWGEMQEAYLADPAGRLYRWDLAADPSDPDDIPHQADSGGTWAKDAEGFTVATAAFRFPACQGAGEFACTIAPIAKNGNHGDVFTLAPAVVANHRIDDLDDPGGVLPLADRDQFLIALASGSANDDALADDFHSSLYLLVDDHRQDPGGGFAIPAGAPTTPPGLSAGFMRLPLSQIQRTRRIVYPDASVEEQTRPFSRFARPLRPPMIRVTGLSEGGEQLDAEVFYITYTIYEPGERSCDERWYDVEAKQWVADRGATYEVRFRLIVAGDGSFDFLNGYALPGDGGDGFGGAGALSGPVIEQVDHCDDGNCGAVLRAPSTAPCDPNQDPPLIAGLTSIQTGYGEIDGFSPLELPL